MSVTILYPPRHAITVARPTNPDATCFMYVCVLWREFMASKTVRLLGAFSKWACATIDDVRSLRYGLKVLRIYAARISAEWSRTLPSGIAPFVNSYATRWAAVQWPAA